MVLDTQDAVIPAGKFVAVPMPVAPVVACVMAVAKAVFMHKVGVAEAVPTVLFVFTVIVPVAFTLPQPPVNGMLYAKVPGAVGVPLIVMVLEAHVAVMPAGKFVAAPMPVAPVVEWVMAAAKAVFTHNTGEDEAAPTVLFADTTTEYVAVAAVQGLLETVIVKVTVFPASPAAAVYVGVNVVAPRVMEPAPFSVQAIVPFDEVTPLTVAVPFEQMV
jgi:hypothetical protein